MPYYCTVPRCTSMAGKNKNVSFHQFPRDEALARLWNKILKRGKPYTKYSKVCSLHFTSEDYTVTSGQKNKGSWRTLRKDAIPSRNLPTDWPNLHQNQGPSQSPPPPAPPMLDPRMHHQMAQAIYVQTMLAMQAASIISVVKPEPVSNDYNSSSSRSESSSPNNHNEQTVDQDIGNIESTSITHENLSMTNSKATYKCIQCSKCFKDPDVFILHQRSHKQKLDEGNHTNQDTLLANPILANLLERPESLRTNTGVSNINNVNSIENQIMMALAANMENYLQNLDSIMTPLTFIDTANERNDDQSINNNEYQETDDRSMECQNFMDDTDMDNEECVADSRSIESEELPIIIKENNESQLVGDSNTEEENETIYKNECQSEAQDKSINNVGNCLNAQDVPVKQEECCDRDSYNGVNHDIDKNNCEMFISNNYQEKSLIGK